jgi:hypothetical protein
VSEWHGIGQVETSCKANSPLSPMCWIPSNVGGGGGGWVEREAGTRGHSFKQMPDGQAWVGLYCNCIDTICTIGGWSSMAVGLVCM